jgi:cyanophycinase
MLDLDRGLLAGTGRARPRVAAVPTACWPDGESAFRSWIAQARAYFGELGAEVEPVEIRHRRDADDPAWAQAIGEADLVYMSGGSAGHLLATLSGTASGAALVGLHARGGAIAGCSAAATALVARQLRVRGRRPVRLPTGWSEGLGLVAGTAVLPRYDALPEALLAAVALLAPRRTAVLGIDGETAAVETGGAWRVWGRGRVTVWQGRQRTRHRAGDTFRIWQPGLDSESHPAGREWAPGDQVAPDEP